MSAAEMGSWSICTVLDNEGILSPSEYNRFRRHNPDRDSKFVRKRFWIKIICGTSCKGRCVWGSMVQGQQYTPFNRSKKAAGRAGHQAERVYGDSLMGALLFTNLSVHHLL